MKTKSVAPNLKHLRYRKALENAIAQGGADLQAEELLAITVHFVGQLIAMQDRRRFTSDAVMTLVTGNIQQGNQEVLNKLLTETGGSA